MKKKIKEYIKTVSNNFKLLEGQAEQIEKATQLIVSTLENKNKVIFCGNGGSASDSQHLSAELMGRYKIDRKPLAAISLTVDTSAITAIGNDYGFNEIFSRQLEGIGEKGDILYATTTSGKSQNIIKAIEKAKDLKITTILVTGQNITKINKKVDVAIHVPSDQTNFIQEMHIAVGQIICGLVEEHFYGGK